MPEEMIAWMQQRGWGSHHEQWHFVGRWDFWHAMADRPDLPEDARQQIQAMVAEAVEKGWTRAAIPEGAAGGGEEFLNDADTSYQEKLKKSVEMMSMDGHEDHAPHHRMRQAAPPRATRNVFAFD
jgi:hypothetical protein